jgi:hypothetical protein
VEDIHAHARTDCRTDNNHHGDPDGNPYAYAHANSDAICQRPKYSVVATIIADRHRDRSSILVLY